MVGVEWKSSIQQTPVALATKFHHNALETIKHKSYQALQLDKF